MLHLSLGLALALVTPNASFAEDSPELDYSSLASADRDEHGVGGGPGNTTLQAILDTPRYKRFDLGCFDVRVSSKCLVEKEYAQRFAGAALAVVDVQRVWYEWTATGDEGFEATLDAFETLRKWVKGWSPTTLASIGRNDAPDVLGRLGAKENVQAAHAHVEKVMSTGSYLGLGLDSSPTSQILFVPERGEFIETITFTGWNHVDARASYWKKGVEQWTSFWDAETQVVAMEYPSFPVDMKHPERGAPMDEFEKTGVGQHAAEKAAATMFWRYYGTNDALFYEAAMGTMLAIGAFGENNVRTGAPVFKNSGGATQAYEVFVPGGNAAGGTLAARGAISVIETPIWRETLGKDYYVKPLQKAAKLGLKHAKKAKHRNKDKRVHFVLQGPEQHDRSFVTAPFFGPGAENKELPEKAYLEDYEEFFRAYRAGFFAWLRVRGMGKKAEEESIAAFSELARRLAKRAEGDTLEGILTEIYGAPMSTENLEEDSLESRFLTYVSKGGR